jgi:hypothetical protein
MAPGREEPVTKGGKRTGTGKRLPISSTAPEIASSEMSSTSGKLPPLFAFLGDDAY